MASNRKAFAVGLFLIVGFAIAITAIIWLGMSNYLDKGMKYVAYFDESVQGLDRDSPVKYRGVSIGRVESLGVAPDATLIQVILSLETDMELDDSYVAQLKSVGITGIMFIELDRKREEEPDRSPKINFRPEYPMIPTKPSGVTLFLEGMDVMLEQIKALDAKGISDHFKDTMEHVSQAIEDVRLYELSDRIQSTLAAAEAILDERKMERIVRTFEKTGASFSNLASDARNAVSDVRGTVSDIRKNIDALSENGNQTLDDINRAFSNADNNLKRALADFRQSMASMDSFLKDGGGLIQRTDGTLTTLQRNIALTLRNLEIASESLNQFLEGIADQPSQLIFGEPIPSRAADIENYDHP